MKNVIKILFIFMLLFSPMTYSTTWVVNVQNFFFSPANIQNVIVGDTIRWQWLSGEHTTTSFTIPQGASTWDVPINGSSQSFSYTVTVAGSYHYVCTPHFPGMEGNFTANIIGITPISSEIPETFKLEQNYPNPFNPVTNIEFSLPKSSFVKLTIINFLGQQIAVLLNEQLNAGSYRYDWNASQLSSGTYFYRLVTSEYSDTKKMILIK